MFTTWFVIAFLTTRIEAFEVAPGADAFARCQAAVRAFDQHRTAKLPKRLIQMLESDAVEKVMCVDAETVKFMLKGKGKSQTYIVHADERFQTLQPQLSGVPEVFGVPLTPEQHLNNMPIFGEREPLFRFKF